jgi:23S rRNA (guanosine2251-2'-O)-methyltransferase
VRSSCDHLLQLPMVGKIASLNAAVAGSVVLYLALESRQKT